MCCHIHAWNPLHDFPLEGRAVKVAAQALIRNMQLQISHAKPLGKIRWHQLC